MTRALFSWTGAILSPLVPVPGFSLRLPRAQAPAGTQFLPKHWTPRLCRFTDVTF